MFTKSAGLRLLTGAALAAAALTLSTGTAHAIDSPYAQAAAKVDNTGSLIYGKNIAAVSKPSTGAYCVRVTDDVDLSKAVIQVTPAWYRDRTMTVTTGNTSYCGDNSKTITVRSYSAKNNTDADASFYLTVS
ncbi:hypothetical protein [Nonomuraea gerenzanensis]|uniref:Uncharacterized protein n=1 Tax=Nonomuraea gerenzanensis TaxID=93944 RepID=A0A1M4EMM9_9ACTN|nr:hypothetical protein [Nonomuraea gerenzanensis]UBU11605.1 hypothetical protein LCN96_46085 [Nonomuraea gerenzanensis]SBP00100.1 hypothetical protein BN4615_P9616 [Nonomuraea gerenzanensis]